MASSRASSPFSVPGPGLSAEELAECELREMMSLDAPQPEPEDDEVDQLSSNQDVPTTSPVAPLTSAASLRNELVYACRKAAQLKLHPYQHDVIEEFVKVMHYFQWLAYVQAGIYS